MDVLRDSPGLRAFSDTMSELSSAIIKRGGIGCQRMCQNMRGTQKTADNRKDKERHLTQAQGHFCSAQGHFDTTDSVRKIEVKPTRECKIITREGPQEHRCQAKAYFRCKLCTRMSCHVCTTVTTNGGREVRSCIECAVAVSERASFDSVH